MSNELKTVVIDAGHGGQGKVGGSSGNNAIGPNGVLEKELTLDIARRTASLLKDSANVILTRNADVNLPLAERADIAKRNNASVFLSLHFNGFGDKTVDGTEVFIGSKAGAASERLAGDVLENVANVTHARKRGVKRADLGVLAPGRQLPETAACLTEIAFLTNPAQAKVLEDSAYRQQIALALGDAVLKNLRTTAASQQSVSFGYDHDDLDERHYQSLDAWAMFGNPVLDIKERVSKTSTNGDDIFAVKKRLIDLGYDWLTLNKKMDSATVDAIKLFQTIIAGNNAISGDGIIDVGKNTHQWLQAVNAPRWQTMPAGSRAEGFFNFELTDTKDTHDFGTDWIADTIKAAGAHYRDNYLKLMPRAALFTINDVSLPHGGDTPDHDGHEAGLACDVQLPKNDGNAGGINLTIPAQKALYDRNAARGILRALWAQPQMSKIFFNDDDLIAEGLCSRLKGHDHHIHFQIKPPARGAIETDGMGNYHSGGRLYQGSHQDDIDYQTHSLDTTCTHDAIKRDEKFLEFTAMDRLSDRANKMKISSFAGVTFRKENARST
jgi:N-acetylmuramoyl-L-alanine amidase